MGHTIVSADIPSHGEKRARTIAYYWLFTCIGLDVGVVGPCLPSLALQTGSAVEALGVLFFLGSAGGTLGTIASARLYDRLSGHRVMGVAQLIEALCLVSVPFVRELWLLCAIFVVKGFCSGTCSAGANTLLVWTHREKSAPLLNGLHFSFGLGAFLSPLIVAQLLPISGGYRWAFWILAMIMAAAAARAFVLHGRPTPPAESTESQETTSEAKRSADARVRVIVITAALYLFFYVSSEISFANWIFVYAVSSNLAPAAIAAYLTSGFWLFFSIGRLVSVPAAVRVSSQRIIQIAIVGCFVSVGVLLAGRGSSAMLWTATLALGFFMAPIWPAGYGLVGKMVSLSAGRSSVVLLGDTLGGMILPALIGVVMASVGTQAMVWLVGGGIVLTAAAFLVINGAGRRLEQSAR